MREALRCASCSDATCLAGSGFAGFTFSLSGADALAVGFLDGDDFDAADFDLACFDPEEDFAVLATADSLSFE
jgi:hypothetical protein